MEKEKKTESDLLISLLDFYEIICRKKLTILFVSILLGLYGAYFALTSPILYEAQGSFQDRGRSNSFSTGLSSLLMGLEGSTGSSTTSVLKSRMILEQTISRIGLQTIILPQNFKENTFKLAYKNLKIDYAFFKNQIGPIFEDQNSSIQLEEVTFPLENILTLKIKAINSDEYEVIYGADNFSIKAKEGNFVNISPEIRFKIKKIFPEKENQTFTVFFFPMRHIIKEVMANLKILISREDTSLLTFQYTNKDRFRASNFINTLMAVYQEHIKLDRQRFIKEQTSYLQDRYEEVRTHLQKNIEIHAHALSKEMNSTGFPNASSAIEFLSNMQKHYTGNLLGIDLELKKLKQAIEFGASSYDKITSTEQFAQTIIAKIRELKQQSDPLELALREVTLKDKTLLNEKKNISDQLNELEEIKSYRSEVTILLDQIQNNFPLSLNLSVIQAPRYMLLTWCNELKNNNSFSCKENFKEYLINLMHLFDIQEKAIEERLTHQQDSQNDFQGVDLETAKSLYLGYSRELDELKAKNVTVKFIIEQMKDPSFELSPLSTVLTDSVSLRLVNEASLLLFSLQDQANRSLKEQERLRKELLVQKNFLTLHLQQTTELLGLRETLIQNKIKSLQSTMLGLIQQQISVLKNTLNNQISTRIQNLIQEKEVIQQHQKDLQETLSSLPQKWVSEKLVNQQLMMSENLFEEISKLVENMNTSSSLEIIKSAPLDKALVPIHPKSPKLVFFIVLWAMLGSFLSSGWILIRSFFNGIPVTSNNLQLSNLHVSGSLSPFYRPNEKKMLTNQDLSTFRRLITFISKNEKSPSKGQSLVIIAGENPDFSKDLASLIAKRDLRVLYIPLSFDHAGQQEELPGLLQFLEGSASLPKIISLNDFDMISPGGICRFTNELLSREKFKILLEELKTKYDWIIASSHANCNDPEGEQLLNQFDFSSIIIHTHTWKEIKPSLDRLDLYKKFNNLSFIFC